MKSLTASDRKAMIRLAASMPTGSEDRRVLLGAIRQADWRDSYLREAARTCKFVFRNQALADLWVNECVGQISDGMWENSRNSGWMFWAHLPVGVGGSTKIEGMSIAIDVRRSFNFTSRDLLDAVGDSMLETVQKTEPQAKMADVIRYLNEIKKAMKGEEISAPPVSAPAAPGAVVAPSGPVTGMPDEAAQRNARELMLKACQVTAGISSRIQDSQITAESFMFASSGGRAGQFHYFVILATGAVCSAYGKFGPKMPKGVLLGQTYSLAEGKKMISAKAKSKISSGYSPAPLAGIRHYLDPITGAITTP